MRALRLKLTLAFLLVTGIVTGSARSEDQTGDDPKGGAKSAFTWSAGLAKANITPKQPMWMSGYGGRNRPAEGKLTDLWAKALMLEDGRGRRALLYTLDLVGISRDITDIVYKKIAAKHKMKPEAIAFCCSHTHTGPVVKGNLTPLHYMQINPMQQRQVDEYAEQLANQLAALADQAMLDLKPSRLSWANDQATFAVNRRNNKEGAVPMLREQGKLVGPVDHDVPVLAIKSIDGKKLRAVVFGYACHATVLSFYEWSGDYPGFAQMEIEKRHPETMALFFAGCGADQNPLPRRKVELAQQYGKRLADAVDRALEGSMTAMKPRLSTQHQLIPVKLASLPTREQIAKDSESSNKFVAARARMFLEQLDAGKPLAKTYPYPVQTWVLDDVQFVTLGGEVVVDYAVRLKSELQGVKTWVAGYANDVMAYIPSVRVLREGGYEGAGAMVYYGLPTAWDASVEETIIDEVQRQLKAHK